jgi:hypothetical protein
MGPNSARLGNPWCEAIATSPYDNTIASGINICDSGVGGTAMLSAPGVVVISRNKEVRGACCHIKKGLDKFRQGCRGVTRNGSGAGRR